MKVTNKLQIKLVKYQTEILNFTTLTKTIIKSVLI